MLKLLEKLGLSQTCSNTESERFLSTVRDRPAKAENDATSFASVSNNLVAIVLSFSVSPTLQQLNQYETYKSAKGFDLKFQISDSYLRSIAFRSVHWWLSGGSFGIARRGRAFSVDRAACRSAVRSGFLGHRSPSVAKNATGPDRCAKQAISEAACRSAVRSGWARPMYETSDLGGGLPPTRTHSLPVVFPPRSPHPNLRVLCVAFSFFGFRIPVWKRKVRQAKSRKDPSPRRGRKNIAQGKTASAATLGKRSQI